MNNPAGKPSRLTALLCSSELIAEVISYQHEGAVRKGMLLLHRATERLTTTYKLLRGARYDTK